MMSVESDEELEQRKFNEKVQSEILLAVDAHSERLKEVLIALRMAGVPLDLLTASVLHELSMRMGTFTEEG